MVEFKMSFSDGLDHFVARRLLEKDGVCEQTQYDNCFSKCPPMIPGPPPPPKSLENYRRKWCTGHDEPWTCNNTNSGPIIYGKNPKLAEPAVKLPPDHTTRTVILSVVLPLLVVIIIVALVLLYIRRRRLAQKNKTDNTYNIGYLSKAPAQTWADSDGTEAVEDGSEIFYQVDRTALSAGINGGGVLGNPRSIPDVVHSSSGTLRKSPNNLSVFDLGRSSSATSQAPLLASPEIAAHNRRRNGHRTTSGGPETADSDLGSPPYARYGAPSTHKSIGRKLSHEASSRAGGGLSTGYMTYSPNTKSHPSLYSGADRTDHNATTVRTPKSRQRSFGSADQNKPRPLRKTSGASNIQRSDSMTLNRAAGRENYRNNWDNFDEVTATMRKNKSGLSREVVLGTDSFIESFTSPEQEEATSVDQLGLPIRNPFLTGYYDYEVADQDSAMNDDTLFNDDNYMGYQNAERDSDGLGYYSAHSPPARSDTQSPDHPPSYDQVMPPMRTPSLSLSQMPTLNLRGEARERGSGYDSGASVEV